MLSQVKNGQVLSSRLALEALRNGVPNREAVKILGCNQPKAERRFEEMLRDAVDGNSPPRNALGMLVSGNFGSGKSHLLTHLEHRALSEGFVCSTVAISKETPLYDLGKVFKSAMDNGRLPDRNGRLIEELGQSLRPDSDEYANFFKWANDTRSNRLHPIFPASLLVHERSNDLELNSEIENFWAGDRILISTVKRGLREIGQLKNYAFRAPKVRDLPPQRLGFMIELIKAAGYKGWVVLLDEIELVAQYSLLQRGRSYAELSRWMGKAVSEQYPGLIVVGTVVDGFTLSVISLDGKKDRDYVEPKLAARYSHLISPAKNGMNLIEFGYVPLEGPTADDVRKTMEKLRKVYTTAYGWNAPALSLQPRGADEQNRMRYRVRTLINEWDLRRLYPDYSPETDVQVFSHTYEENPGLEGTSKDDADDSRSG